MPYWFILIGALSAVTAWAEETPKTHDMQHHGGNHHATYLSEPSVIRYYLPDLSSQVLEKLELPKLGFEGYYALVLEKPQPGLLEAEVRYSYKNGRPMKAKPQVLFGLQKTELEIEPDPHPAEHARYFSGKTWRFKVRFQGQPVPNQPVQFRSQNGSQLSGTTDQQGRVAFELPDDFSAVQPGQMANPPAEFAISTEFSANDQRYRSTLKGDYYVSPLHWQSVPWGAGLAGLGVVVGLWLNRRLSNKPLKVKKYASAVS
jgi:hypothetical protein